MTNRQPHLHSGQKGSALAIRVVPRARRNEIVDILDDGRVKIRLTAPPVEGQANQALITFLADVLGIARSQVEIIGGETSRDKLVAILDVDSQTVQDRLLSHYPTKP